ncbi:basic salivary proline-rich protein 1-like [Chamaea fasciata]|uniref:basic salivary proline-rich protein 1-like n=1 Tax=Chamaea fasciata TaxID=190680 RepID=UPI003369EB07
MAASGQGRKRLRSRCGCSLRFPRWQQRQLEVASHARPRAWLPPLPPATTGPSGPPREKPAGAPPPPARPRAAAAGGRRRPKVPSPAPPPPARLPRAPPPAAALSAAQSDGFLRPPARKRRRRRSRPPAPGPRRPPRSRPRSPAGPRPPRTPKRGSGPGPPPPPPHRGKVGGNVAARTGGPGEPGNPGEVSAAPRSVAVFRSPVGYRGYRSLPGDRPGAGGAALPLGSAQAPQPGGVPPPLREPRDHPLPEGDPQRRYRSRIKTLLPNPAPTGGSRAPSLPAHEDSNTEILKPGEFPDPTVSTQDGGAHQAAQHIPVPQFPPTRSATPAGCGQPGRDNTSPEQPLAPSLHTGAAAARPRRRHVLSPVECAKSLPDVHGGQPDPPPLPPGQLPATGDPRAQPHGTEPIPSRILPGHGARPRLSRGVAAPRPGSAPAAGRAGQRRVPGRGKGMPPGRGGRVAVPLRPRRPRPARARRGRAGSCPAPPAPVPGGSSRAERGCQMESGCRR